MTFRETDVEVTRFANAIRAMGFKKGDKAGVLAPNSLDAYMALLGVFLGWPFFYVAHTDDDSSMLGSWLD